MAPPMWPEEPPTLAAKDLVSPWAQASQGWVSSLRGVTWARPLMGEAWASLLADQTKTKTP
jgi:hypothetical protein